MRNTTSSLSPDIPAEGICIVDEMAPEVQTVRNVSLQPSIVSSLQTQQRRMMEHCFDHGDKSITHRHESSLPEMVVQENESAGSCTKCGHFRRKSQHHSIYLFDDPLPPCCDCKPMELNPAYIQCSPQHHKKTSSMHGHVPLENSCVTFQYYNSQFASNSTTGH